MGSPPAFIGNDMSDLGVIVDRSVFDDDDDELTIPMDLPMVIDEEQSYSDSGLETGGRGARVMKNGRVRRKLRWKPPGFRRNKDKDNVSSNQSVVSSLTTKSAATNRSTSTARSIFSHFSRKSQNSFHTFHSTATPVVKNSRQSQHTFQRPNYHDAFDYGMSGGPSTIANEGHHVHTKMGQSARGMGTIGETLELHPASPDRGVALGVSPMTQSSVEFFDPYGDSDTPVTAVDTAGNMPLSGVVQSSPRGAKPPKPKRPPLFKRKLKFGKGKPPAGPSSPKKTSTSLGSNDTYPTVASSASPLSETISLERQESLLPALESDDFEDDRRVGFREQITRRVPSARLPKQLDSVEETESMYGSITSGNASLKNSMEAVSITAISTGSGEKNTGSPGAASPSRRFRLYNRPVDKTITSNNEENSKDGSDASPSKSRRDAVPVDVNDAPFLEADHNLRAIHDMATEHLAHGEYEEATEVFEEILRGQEARYGVNSYRVGTALHNLGLVHMKSGQYDLAIEVCEKAVSVRREALFPNHPDVAVSLAQLGVAHLENQDYEQALVMFQEALHIRRNHLGPRHPKCAKILNNIGCAEYSLQNYKAALKTFEEALDIQRNALRTMSENGQDKTVAGSNGTLLSVASTLCNVGSILSKQGRLEDAELALEEALLVSDKNSTVSHACKGPTQQFSYCLFFADSTIGAT